MTLAILPAATESLDLDPWVWWVTIGVAAAVLAFDVVWIARNPHRPSNRETGIALGVYIGAAILFGLGMWYFAGAQLAGEYFAGWLTEYSLSVDNLFIFLLIMAKFAVPEKLQQFALMVGIIIAIVLRGIFIWLGAAAIEQLQLGLLHLRRVPHLHGRQARPRGGERRRRVRGEPLHEVGRVALPGHPGPTTAPSSSCVENGKRLATPLFFVIIALGTTDLLFALDSIPAIYGLTDEPYIVLVANLFALMGLRQLYFLLGGLLQRLVYLSIGLAVLLAFIGVKLLLHALHTNELPFINGGENVPRPGDPDLDVARGHRPHPRHHDRPQPAQDPQGRARGAAAPRRPDRSVQRDPSGCRAAVRRSRSPPGPAPCERPARARGRMPRRPAPCPAAGSADST